MSTATVLHAHSHVHIWINCELKINLPQSTNLNPPSNWRSKYRKKVLAGRRAVYFVHRLIQLNQSYPQERGRPIAVPVSGDMLKVLDQLKVCDVDHNVGV